MSEKANLVKRVKLLERNLAVFDLCITREERKDPRDEWLINSYYEKRVELFMELRLLYLSDLYDPFEGKR
jgi:hypothetical protein